MSSGATRKYSLTVLGSGPAGYRAVVQAAKLDQSVCIIEKTPSQLGGAWIHTGTVPSKTVRESMDAIQSTRFHAGSKWVTRMIQDLSAQKLFGRSKKVSLYEEGIVRRYFERYKVDILEGYGSIDDTHLVRCVPNNGDSPFLIESDNILVCTGSRPRRPPEIPFDGWRVLDADEILKLECVPENMIIYGGGVIGCEYATIFKALGVNVTLIDNRTNIMQYVDHEVSEALKESMEESGIEFVLGDTLKDIIIDGPRVKVTLKSGKKLQSDVLFFSAGRTANTERIGLEKVGIKTTCRGHIVVNENFQTDIPNVYATGDAIGSPALAATAASQGRHAALHMFGKQFRPFPKLFPLGVYTIPELSSVGKTEGELKSEGTEYVVGRAHYREVARGYIRGDDHGILKILVAKDTHKILGIHILGHDACNLIHIGLAFMLKNGHAQDLVEMVFNYPTLAEAYKIASFNALNKLFPKGVIGNPPADNQVELREAESVEHGDNVRPITAKAE
jgi:NAD(P) transhydrogenase